MSNSINLKLNSKSDLSINKQFNRIVFVNDSCEEDIIDFANKNTLKKTKS